MKNNNSLCPICKKKIDFSERYPKRVCVDCVKRVTDKEGHKLEFYNQSMSGGFQAFYKKDQKPYHKHECCIDGILCYADEAHLGGIVVQVVES